MNTLAAPDPSTPPTKLVVEFIPTESKIEWKATLHVAGDVELLASGIEPDIQTAISKFHLRAIRGLSRD